MNNSQPTHHDAELILKLYELRREPVMREARNFVAGMSPNSADDLLALSMSFGSKENAYFRQVFGYWEMTASLIVHGTLNPALAYDTCQEMFFVYSIVAPHIKEFREKCGMPDFLKNVEQIVESTPEGKDRVERIQKRRAMMLSRRAAAAN
jgi:hypothetical protein